MQFFFVCTFVTRTLINTTIYTTLKNDTTGSNIYVVPSGHYIRGNIRTKSELAKRSNRTRMVTLGVAPIPTLCQNFNLLATLSALSANVAKHSAKVAKHSAKVAKHSAIVAKHSAKVAKHSANVAKHSAKVAKHSAKVAKHSANVAKHSANVAKQEIYLTTAPNTQEKNKKIQIHNNDNKTSGPMIFRNSLALLNKSVKATCISYE